MTTELWIAFSILALAVFVIMESCYQTEKRLSVIEKLLILIDKEGQK